MDGAKLFREEAIRVKAIAVEKYKAGDLVGAKEFALKAQHYNPTLCGLLRLNAVLDVRMGFARKINGEVDWYAVLSVDPTADIETIKEHYRRLSLDIILDDDNSIGSIEEANQMLDESLKFLCNAKAKQHYDKSREVPLRDVADGGTFWTVCDCCRYLYEYQHFCKDKMIRCFQCYKTFRATECPAPSRVHAVPWSYEAVQRLNRLRGRPVPSLVVKKNLFHVTELRRISTDAGIRRGKIMLPQDMLRRALPGNSKSIITEEEMRGDEKRRRV
ncbi:hypothetical protein V5N11_028032 [Cardamine amara subsp. amara]|uniref:J domain-containing protein n=1 Tax=Cardamine amara subsp. amara TaxID=228776 RepID=A0ABD1AKI8_CARAN